MITTAALHRGARWLVALVLVASAWPSIDTPSNPHHFDTARGLLAGKIWIESPTTHNDIGEINGRFFAPFPPLSALLALFAILTPWPDPVFNFLIVAAAVAAVVLAGRLGDRWGGRAAGTWAAVALGLGSGLWTATVIHDTYHSSHVLAVLAVVAALHLATGRHCRPAAAGLVLGLGALARQSVALAALPLAVLAGGGWSNARSRRTVATILLSVALPVTFYIALNVARFGSPLATGYERVQHHPEIAADLQTHGAFSMAFVPRNLRLMLFGPPILVTETPFVVPSPVGMSILLVSPWLIFALLPLLRPDRPRARWVASWCWVAAVAISVPHLLYVNTGWVQFGYRFALDWLPFLLLAAVLGIRRLSWRLALPPLVLAVLINAWGVAAVASWESWSALVP